MTATSVGTVWQRGWVAVLSAAMVAGCSSSKSAPAAPTSSKSTTTIGAAGGSISLATPEGVTLQLEVPPGALSRDVAITTEPQPAGAGERFRVAVDPPGLIFKVPATLTVTLPTGTFGADTTLSSVAAPSGLSTWLPSKVSLDGKALTASLSVLGTASTAPVALGSAGPGIARVQSGPGRALTNPSWQGFLLVAASLPIDDLMTQLHTYVVQLIADARFDDAVILSLGARVIVDRLGTDTTGWSGNEQRFWSDLKSAVCTGQAATVARANATSPQCVWQTRAPARDLLSTMALEQQLGIDCGGGEGSPARGALGSLLQRTIAFVEDQTHRAAFVACECNDPERLAAEAAGTRRRPPECGAPPAARVVTARLAPSGASPLASVFDHTTAPYEWQLLLETVTVTPDDFTPLYAMAYTADSVSATNQLGGGTVDAVRHHAFALCADNQDSSILEALWRRVGALAAPLSDVTAAIQLDAQRCGAALHAVAERADHSQDGTLDLSFPAAAGATLEGSIVVPADGTLQLSGPIATLRCRDPATFDTVTMAADELWFTAVDGANRSVIAQRFANQAQNVLGTTPAVPVDMHTQLLALNLPTEDSTFDVLIERKGPGCGGAVPAENEVVRVHVNTNLPVTLALGGRNESFPNDPPRPSSVGVVPGDRAVLQATLLRGTVPMASKTVVVRRYDPVAAADVNVATLTTDGQGVATLTVDRPAEGTSDLYFAFWSQDGRDCPDPYTSTVASPSQCHGANIYVQPAVGVMVGGGGASVDKGGTYKFTATVGAGTDQSVNWSVSGLGAIAADGTFTAGQVAGDFTVTATSATASRLSGAVTARVKLSNVDYVGTWTGTSTVLGDPASHLVTGADGTVYGAGYPMTDCDIGSMMLEVAEGDGMSAPIGKLWIHFNPCSGGTLVGQANDLYFYAGSPYVLCDNYVQTSQVTYTSGSGATTMHGIFEIFNCGGNPSWLSREFWLTKG
jgi:hypothetical protein